MDEGRDLAEETGNATVLARPRRAEPEVEPRSSTLPAGSVGGSTSQPGTSIGSPHEALHHAEILRTRTFCLTGGGIAAGALISIPLLPGGYYTSRAFAAGVAISMLGLCYLYYRTRKPETFHDGIGVALGWYILAKGGWQLALLRG